MNESQLFDELLAVCGRLGIAVRYEAIDGQSGGLCRIGGRQVLFVDLLADQATRLDRCLNDLARLPQLDEQFLVPELRERLERLR